MPQSPPRARSGRGEARPGRAFALGLEYGTSFGEVVVSSLALFLIIPSPPT